jgi:hypothetical protein
MKQFSKPLYQFSFYYAYRLKTEWTGHPLSLTRRHPEPSDVASDSFCAVGARRGACSAALKVLRIAIAISTIWAPMCGGADPSVLTQERGADNTMQVRPSGWRVEQEEQSWVKKCPECFSSRNALCG